jgi:competence protein ComEC
MWWLLACADTSDTSKPVSGELTLVQLDLSSASIGESMLVVGPNGTTALIDTGNDAHEDEIAEKVAAMVGEPRVDWLILTHYHADHIGGFGAVGVTEGVVWRGRVDLVGDTNTDELEGVEGDITLCDTSCDTWEAELGPDASVSVLVADGFVAGEQMPTLGDDENARSLGGLVTFGAFSYWFGGDLTGGGKGTPDMEGWLLAHLDVAPVDVLHLGHHGIDSASSDAWLEAMLDGHDANAIVGANDLYLSAPDADVLDRVLPRLGAGKVWVTEDGMTAGSGAEVVHGDVIVRVAGDGSYTVNGEAFDAG